MRGVLVLEEGVGVSVRALGTVGVERIPALAQLVLVVRSEVTVVHASVLSGLALQPLVPRVARAEPALDVLALVRAVFWVLALSRVLVLAQAVMGVVFALGR
jgi:hypothetical protein